MEKTPVLDARYPDCPIRNLLARIGGKWSLLVLLTLRGEEPMRFGALQRAIPDISQKMLAATLRSLEQDGLVMRRVYAQVPPRVEYALTPRARTLLPHVDALVEWAQQNFEAVVEDRRRACAAGGDSALR